ncbi:MAG: hypothetical protein KDC52_05315, partial [Ignavibacteriae bacterium]|nr:hypothetical protein [Ignavibacteriota bacterium]MCB0750873.1 hypothetical protein [Ignavibacteriota bacterium]
CGFDKSNLVPTSVSVGLVRLSSDRHDLIPPPLAIIMRNLTFAFIILTFSSCKTDKDKIISKNSGDAEIYYLNLYESGELKDSIASLTFDLASEKSAKNKHLKAYELYQKANSIEPNNKLILNALGNETAELGRFKKSYEYFEKSLKIDSTFSLTYMNYGVSLNKNKEFDRAIAIYNIGLKYETDSERKGYFYYNIANVYYQMDDYKNSNKYNNKAIELVKDRKVREDLLELKDAVSD